MYKGIQHQPKGSSVVYWIHKPEHTDITKEGYVGITNRMARDRWVDHQSAARRSDKKCAILNRAISKYDNLIWEVVVIADTREYCERIEGLLRPWQRIGWNIAQGGLPVDTRLGGEANKIKWIQYWIDNPNDAAERWWEAEQRLLNKHALEQRKANKPKPYTKPRKHDIRNKSGFTGVSWFELHNKWRAQICFKNVKVTLGYFDTKEKAYETYLKAKDITVKHRTGKIDFDNALYEIYLFQKRF